MFDEWSLGYLTQLLFRVLYRTGEDETQPASYTVQILVSPGVSLSESDAEPSVFAPDISEPQAQRATAPQTWGVQPPAHGHSLPHMGCSLQHVGPQPPAPGGCSLPHLGGAASRVGGGAASHTWVAASNT